MTDAKRMKASSKQAGKRIGGTIGIFIFLLILGLFMALPIYLAIVMSIKPVQELFIFPPKLLSLIHILLSLSCLPMSRDKRACGAGKAVRLDR